MSSVTYGLYLSTNTSTSSLKPVNKTNLNNIKWTINWREIFGKLEGECRVRVKLTSAPSTSLAWSANVGSVRANFASNYQNSTNGFNLGAILPQLDTTTSTLTGYLDCDTIATNGVSMIIPTTNTDLVISFLNANETAMVNVPEYQIWLYFDVQK